MTSESRELNRFNVKFQPLSHRRSDKSVARSMVDPDGQVEPLCPAAQQAIDDAVVRIRKAREAGKSVMLTFGAHTIKNGLGPVLNRLIERGWITHLATNGAGVIHDWEFAFHGETSESVRENVREGKFGNWQETGFYINLAINIGAYLGSGYGQSVGNMINDGGLEIPSADQLAGEMANSDDPLRGAGAGDLLYIVKKFDLPAGFMAVEHENKSFSVQAAAARHGVEFTAHPMFGHDIIYNHPMNHGASIGRCAQRDFLNFAGSISNIDGGVYLSVGSAVMSPMVFEKSFSLAQNLAIQSGGAIKNHYILVVDLAECKWDWSQGEPPADDPAYYLRYNKTFSRMGGLMKYLQLDNRSFLPALARALG